MSEYIYFTRCLDPDSGDLSLPLGTSSARHHHHNGSNNRKCRPLKGADVLSIRYGCPSAHVNYSHVCSVHTIGINLSSRIRIVWRRSKANINRLLGNAPPETPTEHGAASRLPYEIVEMITTHIAHDLHALKAFSLTCYSWYISAAPHLHCTFSFGTFDKLRPLSKLHRLGLMPLIKEILVEQYYYTWLALSHSVAVTYTTLPPLQTFRL